MIIRGLVGVLIGAAYGALVGVIVFLITRIGLEPERSSSLIMLDPIALAWLGTILAALVTGICGILIGLVVGLWGTSKTNAAKIGLGVGLLVIASLFVADPHAPRSFSDFVGTCVVILILPVGLALMSALVAVAAERLKPYDL